MMKFLLEQILIMNLQAFVLLTVLVFTTSQNPPIARHGCMYECGSVPIPFPFGTTKGCYYSDSFLVTCDRSSSTPKLFLQTTMTEIKNISLLGQMTVMQDVASACSDVSRSSNLQLPIFLTVNNIANKFTVVGCNAYGYAEGYKRSQRRSNAYGNISTVGRATARGGVTYGALQRDRPAIRNRRFSTGCTASCSFGSDMEEEDSCTGLGCCQTSIPENVWNLTVWVGCRDTMSSISDPVNSTTGTYGFIVQDSEFRFSLKNLANWRNIQKLPMVVDWVIGNSTNCTEAENSSDYACKSTNSECYKPKGIGYGYRCLCRDGYHGNPYLINGCQDIDECSPPPGQNKSCESDCINTPGGFICPCPKGFHGDAKIGGKGCSRDELHKATLGAGIALGVILLLLVACLACMGYNRWQSKRVKQKWFIHNGGEKLLERLPDPKSRGSYNMFQIFTSSELKRATNDFHRNNIVGHGGFGTVYVGYLSDQRMVAIKKSKIVDEDQIDQFVNEVVVISQTNHRNIVQLLGCCLETEVPLLVYEFVSNGTLSSYLHDPENANLLNWEIRLRIAADTASVLWYLHSAAAHPIIHRDVKSDNILLDHSFTAKVSDFGASRLIALDQTQISTVVLGTTGYLDPEYLQTHQLTTKSDVYSFGVVLLELLTGRKAVSYDRPAEEKSLVIFSLSKLKKEDSFFSLIDENIASEGNRKQLMKVAHLAEWCLKMTGEERPAMNIVSTELENIIAGREQSLVQTKHNAKALEPLLLEGFDGIIAGDGGSSKSVGSDGTVDEAIPLFRGGR